MLIYASITDGPTYKHTKSIARNLTKFQFQLNFQIKTNQKSPLNNTNSNKNPPSPNNNKKTNTNPLTLHLQIVGHILRDHSRIIQIISEPKVHGTGIVARVSLAQSIDHEPRERPLHPIPSRLRHHRKITQPHRIHHPVTPIQLIIPPHNLLPLIRLQTAIQRQRRILNRIYVDSPRLAQILRLGVARRPIQRTQLRVADLDAEKGRGVSVSVAGAAHVNARLVTLQLHQL